MRKRIIAWCLSVLMLFSNVSMISATETEEAAAGSFYLSAVTDDKVIIEPAAVSYTSGQTVRDALRNSGYEFYSLDSDYIYEIEGEVGSFYIYMNDGGYNLDRPASEVSVVSFTEGNFYSFEMVSLIEKMGEINTLYSNAKKFESVKNAYMAALDGILSATATKASNLLADLNQAWEEYEAYLNSDKVCVTVNTLQNEETVIMPEITFTDKYGNTTTATGNTISVIPGDYTFSISDGGYNRTEGSITVTEGTVIDVELPYGEWFGDIKILNRNKEAYVYTLDKENHTAEYYVQDARGSMDARINVMPGTDTPMDAEGVITADLYACYVSLSPSSDGTYNDYGSEAKSANKRSWMSTTSAMSGLVLTGMDGREFELEARYTGTDGYKQIQSYHMTVHRVPTLKTLTVTDGNGTSLLSDFDPYTQTYSLSTISEILDVQAVAYEQDEYTISVNAEKTDSTDPNRVYIEGNEPNQIQINVDYKDGQHTTYTLHVTKVTAATVTMSMSAGVTVEVQNQNGSVISSKTGSVYELIPGETYTYIATKNKNYHTSSTFTAANGMTVNVAEPVMENAISNIALYNSSSVTRREEYKPDAAFSATDYEYSYVTPDAVSALYSQVTTETGYTATARYVQQHVGEDSIYNGVFKEQNILNKPVSSTGSTQTLTRVLARCGYGNELVIRGWKISGEVTYYQDYVLTMKRSLHINDLSVMNGAETLSLMDAQDSILEFDRDIKEYYVQFPADATCVQISSVFMNESDANELCGGYYALINGERFDDISNITMEMDSTKAVEDISITVCHINEDTESNTYVVHIEKVQPVTVTFQTNPEEAIVFIESQLDGKSPEGAKNVFNLIPGQKYTYTVTCNGYQGRQVTDYTVPDADDIVQVTLTKAEANNNLQDLEAQWSSFRGDENNNGVIGMKTPISAEDAVLYWASKIGAGYDSNAAGCPILVDGYLYTYAGTTIVKVDTITGEIVASGAMNRGSSFAINSPTYADGMIFVGLANGGIQAFDAVTLESLWIYNDKLKGQPNTELTYHNGYLYTGFWTGEQDDAHYVCISTADEEPSKTNEEKLATWTHTQTGGFYWAGAYVCDQFVLVGTDDGKSGYTTGYAHIVTFDPVNGNIIDDMQLPVTGDIRSNIVYDANGTKYYYFTCKGGYFFRVSLNSDGTFKEDSLKYIKLENGTTQVAMSTSTPTIYNGRAYIGVSGSGAFTPYSGHNISVIDLVKWRIAYQVPTQGYPQTSGILTNAYEEENGKVYVYFFDNYTPGKLRMISDQPGQTAPAECTTETYSSAGDTISVNTGYVLFTPSGSQAQYVICTPIVDEYGNIYFKNDSGYMMMLGSTIEKLEVTKLPNTVYKAGEVFDYTGMEVTITYSNSSQRIFTGEDVKNYITYSKEPLTVDDSEFQITFDKVMYQNKDSVTGVEYTAPMAMLSLEIFENEEDMEAAKELMTVKENAKVKLDEYKNPEDYRDAEKEELAVVIEAGKMAIDAAKSIEEIDAAVEKAKIEMDAIKTADEYVPENPFVDVYENDYYYKSVLWAVDKGITAGVDDTRFGSDEVCTRAQAVTFLWRAIGSPEPETTTNPFVDVTEKNYYYKAVLWASENKITNGTDKTHFSPDATVTRAQFVSFLWRLQGKEEASISNPFVDVYETDYYYKPVLWAVENKITAGTDATRFSPDGSCLRCQVVTFLYRTYHN